MEVQAHNLIIKKTTNMKWQIFEEFCVKDKNRGQLLVKLQSFKDKKVNNNKLCKK